MARFSGKPSLPHRVAQRIAARRLASAAPVSPVFIIGSGRSGNTLLRRLLCAGDDLYIPPETYVLGEVIRTWKKYPTMEWSHRVSLLAGLFTTGGDFQTFPDIDLGAFIRNARALTPERQSLADVLDLIYRDFAQAAGSAATRWGDKTPLNTNALEGISKTFPEAQFLHILRDPWDASLSYMKMSRYTRIEEAARRWREANRNSMALGLKAAPGKFLQVRYENLVRHPGEELERVCTFLGLDYSPEMLDPVQAETLGDVAARAHHARAQGVIDASSIGKGHREMAPKDRQTVEKICGEMARDLGYCP